MKIFTGIAKGILEHYRTKRNRGITGIQILLLSILFIVVASIMFLGVLLFNLYSQKSTAESEGGLEVTPAQLNVNDKDVKSETPKKEKEILSCTSSSWSCGLFGKCSGSGQQIRDCILIDTECSNPDLVKPETVQICILDIGTDDDKNSRRGSREMKENDNQQEQVTCTPTTEICDGIDNDCNGLADNGDLCGVGQLCLNGNCEAADPNYKVQPVIFFPTDYIADQDMVNYLKEKFEEIRQFYLNENGVTFTMLRPQVVSGNNDHEWYWCVNQQQGCITDNFEANVIRELKNKGFPVEEDWNIYPADKVTWVVAFGGGGYAGGRQYPTGGGFSMLGDAGIYAAKDGSCGKILDYYYSPEEPNNIKDVCQNTWLPSGKEYGFGIGALGHELGHAFGMPHPDGYSGTTPQDWEETIIGNHWNYPNTGLLQQDKDILAQSAFFNVIS